jgi:hypothetical protein
MQVGRMAVWTLVLLLALPLMALAADDYNEKTQPDGKGGHVIFVRYTLGTAGMGIAQCGTCNTAAGCKSVWCRVGPSVSCRATPAKGWKFTYWSANGNFAGDKPSIRFCRKGADLRAQFEKGK